MAATRRPWLVIGLATVMLAACTSTEDALIQRGLSPAYAAGYDHGCSSGQVAGGGLFGETQKDQSRYASDSEYTKGWDAGFAKCKRDQEVMARDARARNPSRDK
jgi:hypothetical protein